MVSFSNSVEAQDEKSPASILAVDFPSIQAALDSLPASGGMVQLPPGTTEITEPLLITTPETRIEGSGPSTHIKNLNTEGKPALLIQPAERSTDPKVRLWRIQLGNF